MNVTTRTLTVTATVAALSLLAGGAALSLRETPPAVAYSTQPASTYIPPADTDALVGRTLRTAQSNLTTYAPARIAAQDASRAAWQAEQDRLAAEEAARVAAAEAARIAAEQAAAAARPSTSTSGTTRSTTGGGSTSSGGTTGGSTGGGTTETAVTWPAAGSTAYMSNLGCTTDGTTYTLTYTLSFDNGFRVTGRFVTTIPYIGYITSSAGSYNVDTYFDC